MRACLPACLPAYLRLPACACVSRAAAWVLPGRQVATSVLDLDQGQGLDPIQLVAVVSRPERALVAVRRPAR
jgi:hypothetical protein